MNKTRKQEPSPGFFYLSHDNSKVNCSPSSITEFFLSLKYTRSHRGFYMNLRVKLWGHWWRFRPKFCGSVWDSIARVFEVNVGACHQASNISWVGSRKGGLIHIPVMWLSCINHKFISHFEYYWLWETHSPLFLDFWKYVELTAGSTTLSFWQHFSANIHTFECSHFFYLVYGFLWEKWPKMGIFWENDDNISCNKSFAFFLSFGEIWH